MKTLVRILISLVLVFSMILSAMPVQAAVVDTPPPSPTMAVSGRVTDGNGHGLPGVTITALPGHRIYLPSIRTATNSQAAPVGPFVLPNNDENDLIATTDAEGYYHFPALPAGKYEFRPERAGIQFTPASRIVDASTTVSQDFSVLILPPIIPDITEPISPESNQYLDAISPDGTTYTFSQSTPELQTVSVGDIIIGQPVAAAPNGYLRKVTQINTNNGSLELTTEPALLEEAVQDGSVYYAGALNPADVSLTATMPGVTMQPAEPGSLTFSFNVDDLVFIDLDGDESTKGDQIRVNGSIEFELNYEIYYNIRNFKVQNFTVVQESALRDTLEIFVGAKQDFLDKEVILATQSFTPVVVMVGIVPLVFTPRLDVVIGANGSVEVGMSTSVSHELALRAGISYTASNGWRTIGELTHQFPFTQPQAALEATLKGYFGTRLDFYLYGLAGPYIKVTPYLELKVTPLETPWWELSAGVNAPAGYRVIDPLADILNLDEYESYAINVNLVLAHAQTVHPGEVVFIPAGEFQMGCDPSHNGGYACDADELPLHLVYLDPYLMDKYEVTNAQYSDCVSAGSCTAPSNFSSFTHTSYYDNPAFANYPVIYVDWQNAASYCAWLGGRLPTEAEWEKAARGDNPQAFAWGDAAPTCDRANVNQGNCVGDTSPVGSYPMGASPYGLMDMTGNVWEWVGDWYSNTYYRTTPVSNPPGPGTGIYKVLRGGSWYSALQDTRAAYRHKNANPDSHYYTTGFRCVFPFTVANHAPDVPSAPQPANGQLNVSLNPTLSWTSADLDYDQVFYDVYLEAGDNTPDLLAFDDLTALTFSPGTLDGNTTYFWKIIARDEHDAVTEGPVWQFTTDPVTGQVLFSDTFDGGLSQWSDTIGNWSIQNGELNGHGAGGQTDGWIYAGNTNWTNYALEAKVIFVDYNAELVVRSTGHWQNEYRITIWENRAGYFYQNMYQITKYQNGEYDSLTQGNMPSPVIITNPCTVRVEAVGGTLKLYINNQYVNTIVDANPLTSGRVGLGVIWDYYNKFDNVVVTALSESQ